MSGPRVLVTRANESAGPLCDAITARGGVAVAFPLIAHAPGPDVVDAADVAGGDVVVALTSSAAVDAVRGIAAPVAVVGDATRDAAVGCGLDVVLVADGSGAGALADALIERGCARVLWPCGDRALPTLEERLVAAEITVVRRVVYRTILGPPPSGPSAEEAFRDLSAVIFTSPSTVEALVGCRVDRGVLDDLKQRARAVAIGGTTRKALESSGFRVIVVADEPSSDALATAALGR